MAGSVAWLWQRGWEHSIWSGRGLHRCQQSSQHLEGSFLSFDWQVLVSWHGLLPSSARMSHPCPLVCLKKHNETAEKYMNLCNILADPTNSSQMLWMHDRWFLSHALELPLSTINQFKMYDTLIWLCSMVRFCCMFHLVLIAVYKIKDPKQQIC